MKDLVSGVDKLFAQIKNDFNALWVIQRRNATVEFITPYTTLSGDAVSVFVTQRENGYVVSDAGRVFELASDQEVAVEDRKVFHHSELINKFGVKVVRQREERREFYYKITSDIKMMSSLIYDMAHFQKALMDAILLDTMFVTQESSEAKFFSRRVKETLREKVRLLSSDKDKYELYTDDNVKMFQFTTGVRKVGTNERWLGMSIFCTNVPNLVRSVQRANFGFEFVEKEPGLKMASICDKVPEDVLRNKKSSVLQLATDKWHKSYGVENYQYLDVVSMKSMEFLFGSKAA